MNSLKWESAFALLILIVLIALSVAGILSCSGGGKHLPERVLRYDAPAAAFEASLPLGNGRIGAAVYGGTEEERIVLNEETLWAGGPVDPHMNPDAFRHLPAVRSALRNENYQLADKLVRKLQGKFSESYAPLGDLILNMDHGNRIEQYRRELDLRTAVANVSYKADKVRFTREYFVSHPDQVFVIKMTAGKRGALNFALEATSKLKHWTSAHESVLAMKGWAPVHAEPSYRGKMPNAVVYDEMHGMRFMVLVKVIPEGGSVEASGESIAVKGADAAVILVSVATSFNGFDKDPGTEGRNESEIAWATLEKTVVQAYETLKKKHAADFSSLFNRVTLQLGDAADKGVTTDERLRDYTVGGEDSDLEALYFQYGRYLLISSSRQGGIPANLQGIWNPHIRPPWSSNYTTNINAEMNYWPAEVCNLSETHEPLLTAIGHLAETGAVTAGTFFNADGWCCCHNTDIWAMTNPVGDFGKGHPCWANWNMAGAWLSTHLYEHFLFTQDTTFLRDYGYPLMRGAAEFCLDWLVSDGRGHLVTSPSTSPENIYKTPEGYKGATLYGATADLAMIRELFLHTVDAATLLEQDAAMVRRMEKALKDLYPYQVGEKGNLQEWYHDWEDNDPQHRHMSHLFGLYPGHHITPQATPDLAEACRRSLELRGDGGTGWSKAWKIALWARLQDGDHAHKMLRTHLHYVDPSGKTEYRGGGTYPNLWDAHPPFQIDGNFGGTAGIAEMLLQSHNDEIHILPALPSVWPEGRVKGLCARDGYVVDIAWREGRLVEVQIQAKNGGEAVIRYGENSVTRKFDAGEVLVLDEELDER